MLRITLTKEMTTISATSVNTKTIEPDFA